MVRQISHKIAVMYLGKIVEFGDTQSIIENSQHPYTRALISAVPVPGKPHHERIIMKGEVPSAAKPPSGCRFHTRCPFATDICSTLEPLLTSNGKTQVACHHPQL